MCHYDEGKRGKRVKRQHTHACMRGFGHFTSGRYEQRRVCPKLRIVARQASKAAVSSCLHEGGAAKSSLGKRKIYENTNL